MNKGYVKLWRKSLETGLIQNPNLWTFFSYCLLRASHKDFKTSVGSLFINLKPGQFIFGRKQVSRELNMSEQTIRTCLKNLKKLEILTTKPTNKYTLVTIINWEFYQSDDEQLTSNLTSIQPATNQQLTTKQTQKNGRRSISSEEDTSDHSDHDLHFESNQQICPHKKIIDLYHRILSELPKVRVWNESKKKILRARWKENKDYQSLDWWENYFNQIKQSNFLMGRTKDFQADLEWLIRPNNFAKVLNGRYENRDQSTASTFLTGKDLDEYIKNDPWCNEGIEQ